MAEAAGFDHSYVSRLEMGTRMPTRDAVGKLAQALKLDQEETNLLYLSAGFTPNEETHLARLPPEFWLAGRLLDHPDVPDATKDMLLHTLRGIIDYIIEVYRPDEPEPVRPAEPVADPIVVHLTNHRGERVFANGRAYVRTGIPESEPTPQPRAGG